MSQATSLQDLMNQAAEAGFSGILPDGPYQMTIGATNAKKSQGGKWQVGIQFKVASGPSAGQSTWMNQTLTADNPQALAVFFRIMRSLGVDDGFMASVSLEDLTPLAARIAQVNQGKVFSVKVGNRSWGTPPKIDNTFEIQGSAAGTPGVPLQQAVPVAVAAPVPVAVAVAAPAPVAPAALEMTPEQLAAAVAAFQAQQAATAVPTPAPAPAAPVPVAAAPAVDPTTGLPPRPGQGI